MTQAQAGKGGVIQSSQFKPKDSFQKFAADVFGGDTELFKQVHPLDRDEVRVQFSRMVAEEPRASDLRVMPLHMTEKFRTGGTPEFVQQVKVRASGRIYWVGFALTAQMAKAA